MADVAWSGTLLMMQGSEVLLEQSIGEESVGLPITGTSRFQAGSISKLVVAVIILQLAEQGVLTLREPVGRWLPDAPEAWRPLTLHQLLTHTSGLGHWGDVPGLDLSASPSAEGVQALIRQAPPVDVAGRRFAYSGIGYLVAAEVAARVTDHAYADLVHQLIVDRVGMARTTSGHYPAGQLGVALGHHDGARTDIAPVLSAMPGTGDLWTTASDLITFAQALRGDLGADGSWNLIMSDPVPIPDQRPDGSGVIKSAAGYGLNTGSVLGHPAFLSSGDNPGYQSLLAWFPEADVDLVILSNDDGLGISWPVHAATTLLGPTG